MNLFPYASAIALSWAFVASLLQAFISQFNAVSHAPVSRDDALSDSISLFWLSFLEVSVACKHIEIIDTHYFIPFKLYC